MSSHALSIDNPDPKPPSLIEEMQCGKLGLSIVCANTAAAIILCINTVAVTVFATTLAAYGSLIGAISLGCAIIMLPSMYLFGVKNYFSYLPKPLMMGIGYVISLVAFDIDEKTGIWSGKWVDWAHFYDARLNSALIDFFQQEKADSEQDEFSIADFGCGMGDYVQNLQKEQGLNCIGFDGNPNTPEITKNTCEVANLATAGLNLGRKFDGVMSLEVGEHLPPQSEEIFLKNLVSHAEKVIVLSWAKPGQGGQGHVNEQPNDYIEKKMTNEGWYRDSKAENNLRIKTSAICPWFRDTIMVYRPNEI